MSVGRLVNAYIDAWNRKDVGGLLALMHPGAAYYDAFWMESCVGCDLAQYLQDSMDEEPYWYELVGDVISTASGVVYRYSAHDRLDSGISEPVLHGAEVFITQDNKILTISDFYCSPDREYLIELAELVAKRHGVATYTNSGVGALKAMRLKAGRSDSRR